MTKWSMCPYCHREYDGGRFEKCPNCRLSAAAPTAAAKSGNAGVVVVVLVLLVLAACGLSQCASCSGGSAPSSPTAPVGASPSAPAPNTEVPSTISDDALAAKAESALASAGGSAAVHDVLGLGNGQLAVTLNLTIDAMGGKVIAEDNAKAVANIIFASVPEATEVLVRDANRDSIDLYKRK